MAADFTVDRKGGITVVTLNRPEVMNAMHHAAHLALADCWDEFARDPAQHVAILTGAGDRAFCAGDDLKAAAAGAPRGLPPAGFCGLTGRFDLGKPVIAAVNGYALGGGFETALACDLIVAAENAVFGLPEPRVGIAALAGGIQRLVRQVPLKQAMLLLLTGQRVSAREGLAMGFVTEVAPPGQALEAALALARQILECSPASIRATRQVAMRSLDMASLEEACRQTYPAVVDLQSSPDGVEGAKAFAEKRKPRWAGLSAAG